MISRISLSLLILAISIFHGTAENVPVRLEFHEQYRVLPLGFLSYRGPAVKRPPDEILASAERELAASKSAESIETLKPLLSGRPLPSVQLRAYVLLGRAYFAINRADECIACFKNAEAVLSSNRGADFNAELKDLLAEIYSMISLAYLKSNKYASAIVYLWAAGRQAERFWESEPERPRAAADSSQKSLYGYPLYGFLASPLKDQGLVSSKAAYYRRVRDLDADFLKTRKRFNIREHIFMKPEPADEVKAPADRAGLYSIYRENGAITAVEYNDSEAPDFNKIVFYRDGRPVSSFYESNTYNHGIIKFKYDGNGRLEWLLVIKVSTQTGHYGFIPDVWLYVFK
ncbi:MAG: hypothetical protein MUD12_06345 [Spirochaetes bacterium]|jgi:tetratricopeptide (TPR) repeat protein|nr:hypothetical protein [Spirochaetota bacterium]